LHNGYAKPSPAVADALAELREVVRAMTRRVAMLEVELAGRQAIPTGGRNGEDVEDVEAE
jgi:hypothetical protein